MNKYRSDSMRQNSWDYTWEGSYFITINTKNRTPYFGEFKTINNSKCLYHSEIGLLASHYWREIPSHFPFVHLGAHVIMPDHMHGIINILPTPEEKEAELPDTKNSSKSIIPHYKSGSLGAIINQYKRKCTIESRKINPMFGWQPNYWDSIILDPTHYDRVERYIRMNPLK